MQNRPHLILAAITAIAAVLRFYGLGSESLWLDEAFVASRISGSYWDAIYHWDVQWQGSFFPLMEKLWCDLFGRSEYALRFLPALFGTLAVPAIYLLGRRIFSPTAGLLAAFLLAINPFAIHFSQDARPYTLFLLLVVLSVELGMRLLETDLRQNRILFSLSTLGALYSHPFGVFLLPLFVALPFAKNKGVNRGYKQMVMVVTLLYLPMCAVFLRSLILKSTGVLHDADFIKPATWSLLWDIYQKYFMSANAALFSIVLIISGAIWGTIRKADVRAWRVPELLGICFVILPALLSWVVTPILEYRYSIPALAGVLLLLAWSMSVFPRWIGAAFLVIMTCFSGFALADYYTKLDKDPWRQTLEYMRPQVRAGDLIVISPPWTLKGFTCNLTSADSVRVVGPWTADSVATLVAEEQRFWLVHSFRHSLELRDSVMAAVLAVAEPSYFISARDSHVVNPRAYLVRDIRADLYVASP